MQEEWPPSREQQAKRDGHPGARDLARRIADDHGTAFFWHGYRGLVPRQKTETENQQNI